MIRVLHKLQEEKVFSIKRWFYDENSCEDWFRSSPITRARTSFWRGQWSKTKEFPDISVNISIEQQMDWLMQEFARDTEYFREFFYEYNNIIAHMANEYYTEIRKANADVILFSDVPHGPIASLLYIVARAMNIDTILVAPAANPPFPWKFMYSHTMEDYGTFATIPDYHTDVPDWHIEKSFKKNLAYMTPQQIKQDRGEDWERKFKIFRNPAAWVKDRKSVIKKNFEKYESVSDFLERKSIQFVTKQFRNYQYHNNLRRFAQKDVNLSNKFVYMPLHLQPEMTVDTIGGIFRDQILAIEKIRNIIPHDWLIYVKENPKQLTIARDKYFFKRLSAISNTVLVDRSVDTYKLIEKSQFVATITGTAAWESITGGKPALIFGHVWFETLPGIIRYHEGLKKEDILNYTFTHSDLEKAVTSLTKKLCDGAWLPTDISLITNFDAETNFTALCNSMKFIFQG